MKLTQLHKWFIHWEHILHRLLVNVTINFFKHLVQGLVYQLRSMSEVFGDSLNSGRKQSDKKLLPISEARPILEKAEEEKLTDSPTVSFHICLAYILYMVPSLTQTE